MYTNSDQFPNKKEELLTFIVDDKPDIIMITEMIPKAQINPILKPLLDIPGYNMHANFDNEEARLGASGIRGVAIYTNFELSVREVNITGEHKDQIWIEISFIGKDTLLVGCIYRSPTNDKTLTAESTMRVSEAIKQAMDRKNSHILIGGDFNYKEIDWENEFVEECNIHLTPFINTIQDHFLTQHVTESTRYRQGEQPNLLDLILTNEEGMVQNLTYHPGLGDSDHCCLKFDLNCYAHYSNTTEKINELLQGQL